MLSNLGEDIQDDMVQAMIELGDTNNCGEVSYVDFVRLMTGKPLPQKSVVSHGQPSDLRKMFDEIDIDGAFPDAAPPASTLAPPAEMRPSCLGRRLRAPRPVRGEAAVRQAGC